MWLSIPYVVTLFLCVLLNMDEGVENISSILIGLEWKIIRDLVNIFLYCIDVTDI
jgi:septum formation inhibitor-activating ATPase MinD